MPVPPTIADIARTCGVSLATVSKALSPYDDRCDVSLATRERIRAAARDLGWTRDQGQSRRARRTWRNVGLLWGRVAPFTDGVYDRVLERLAGGLADLGWRALFAPVPRPEDWAGVQMAQRLDGVIVMPPCDDRILARLEAADYPAVLLNLPSSRRLHQILADDRGGAEALGRHLVEAGHRQVVWLPDRADPPHASEAEREAGLTAALAAVGARPVVVPDRDIAAAVEACRQGATAVATYAWGAVPPLLEALAAAGLPVPGRVAVACTTDVRWFRHLTPPVTAVEVPMEAMAAAAVRAMAARLGGGAPPPPGVETCATTLHIRASSAGRKPAP